MSVWKINQIGKRPVLKNSILIEGLPGIGNVGKVAIDFIIDELKAKKIFEIYSYTFPHSVFVNEQNLVELPTIEIYYKKFNDKRSDLLLLAGDIQPVDEASSYEFSEKMLDLLQEFNGKEVITMGGIGLSEIPKKPKVYCSGNSKLMIDRYKEENVENKLYGVVGPIVGVSGLLPGLAKNRKIDAIVLLAETYGHPMYLGIKGAREILIILDKKLHLGIDVKKLDNEIKEVEKEVMRKTEQVSEAARLSAINKLKSKIEKEADYIG